MRKKGKTDTLRRSFKYRCYPVNDDTIKNCERWFKICRFVYNSALEYKSLMWTQYKQHIPIMSAKNHGIEGINGALPGIKKDPELSWIAEVGAEVLLDCTDRLDKAFKHYFDIIKLIKKRDPATIEAMKEFYRREFRKNAKNPNRKQRIFGYPQYKKFDDVQSLGFRISGWVLDSDILTINRLGQLKIIFHRPIQGRIKCMTLVENPSSSWYVAFSCEDVTPKQYPEPQNGPLAIDVNVNNILTDQDGNRVENDAFILRAEKKLRRLQRHWNRQITGSHRWENTKIQIAKLHEHIANQRKDRNHKLSYELVRDNSAIYHEALNIKKMVRRPEGKEAENGEFDHTGAEFKSKLNKGIHDVAWGQFFGFLKYKADEAKREIIKVDPAYTTLTCCVCGTVDPKLFKKVGKRMWECDTCGNLVDEDQNAAINIMRRATGVQALNYDE